MAAGRALTDGEYHATIYDVVVDPEYQRRGVGSRVMSELLARLPVWRVLLVAGREVQPFYRRLGFESYAYCDDKVDQEAILDHGGLSRGLLLRRRSQHQNAQGNDRAEIRADQALPEWTPAEWINALVAKLGEGAFHSAQFLQAIRAVFPGSAADSMEQFKYAMIAVAAVAMDAVEALEEERP